MFDATYRGFLPSKTRYIARMEFSGQVWFKFDCKDAWLFYRFVRSFAEADATVSLEWVPLPTEGEELAASALSSLSDPDDRGRFLHAMLGLVHIEGLAVGSAVTVAKAIDAAGVEGAQQTVDRDLITALTERAGALGVSSSPSLYRHGPVTAITLTPAVLEGDPVRTAEAILAVADNDGIWGLQKP